MGKIIQAVIFLTTIYLIRHAESEGNLCRRLLGQHDGNVTLRGLRQIADLKRRFENIHVDACYCSDLTRAENTALAVTEPNGLEYRVDPGFREVGVGDWENFPVGYLNTYHGLKMIQFGRDPVNWSVPGSETFPQYTRRFLDSMNQAVLRHEGGVIAIVTHSMVMRGALSTLFPDLKQPSSCNTAVSCLTYENGVYTPQWIYDGSHLSPENASLGRQKWWQQDGAQGDDTFWYRPGLTPLEELQAPESPIAYTVLEDQRPVGLICLSEENAETGRVDYIGLIPAYRGFDLAVQLMGQGITDLRDRGKHWMRLRGGDDPILEALCRKLLFVKDGADWVLDLSYRVMAI